MSSCGANSGKWRQEFRCKDQVLSNSIKTDKAKQKFVVNIFFFFSFLNKIKITTHYDSNQCNSELMGFTNFSFLITKIT
jgi:hypothetical protein